MSYKNLGVCKSAIILEMAAKRGIPVVEVSMTTDDLPEALIEYKGLTEYDIMTNQPENMNVGQLNMVVRALREKLHHQALLVQEGDMEGGGSEAAGHRNTVRAAIQLYHAGHLPADEVYKIAVKELPHGKVSELSDNLLTARYEAERRFVDYLEEFLKG